MLVPPDAGLREGARPGWDEGAYAFMRRVLASEAGQELYKHRKAAVEPVFAQNKFSRRFRPFQRRGRSAVRSECCLFPQYVDDPFRSFGASLRATSSATTRCSRRVAAMPGLPTSGAVAAKSGTTSRLCRNTSARQRGGHASTGRSRRRGRPRRRARRPAHERGTSRQARRCVPTFVDVVPATPPGRAPGRGAARRKSVSWSRSRFASPVGEIATESMSPRPDSDERAKASGERRCPARWP